MLGLGHFVDDYLLDFDIYHVSHVTELVMYIDAKYLSRELGRCVGSLNEVTNPSSRWQWSSGSRDLVLRPTQRGQLHRPMQPAGQEPRQLHQDHPAGGHQPARKLRLHARGGGCDNDVPGYNVVTQVAHKNRSYYRQLRTELHDLSTDGLYLQQSCQEDGANPMQKLSGNNQFYFVTSVKGL